jgi:hypothetical protein
MPRIQNTLSHQRMEPFNPLYNPTKNKFYTLPKAALTNWFPKLPTPNTKPQTTKFKNLQ